MFISIYLEHSLLSSEGSAVVSDYELATETTMHVRNNSSRFSGKSWRIVSSTLILVMNR